jgi:hypothetical protein
MTVTPPPAPPWFHQNWQQRYDAIMSRQATAALQVTGAGQSAYNGTTVDNPTGTGSHAAWDGTLAYDQGNVSDAMRNLAAYSGQQRDPATLQWYRQAVQSMLHENSHMLTARGDDYAHSAPYYAIDHNKALEEGITEAWSRAHVNDYIAAMNLEQDAPGISGVVTRDAYPQYTPAATTLCNELGRDTRRGDEVMRRLNNQSVRAKWPAAADMMFRSSGLQHQLPVAEHNAARLRIQHAMQQNFDHLPTLQGTPQQVDLASRAAGQAAVQAGRNTVNQLRAEVAQRQAQAAHLAQAQNEAAPQNSHQAPGWHQAQGWQQAQGQHGQGWQQGLGQQGWQQGQGQRGWQQQGQQGQWQQQAPPDPGQQVAPGSAQHAMSLAQSGVAPMSGATTLGADQFGSRGDTRTGGNAAERTTPQRGDRG